MSLVVLYRLIVDVKKGKFNERTEQVPLLVAPWESVFREEQSMIFCPRRTIG